jgi:hypothetical protein
MSPDLVKVTVAIVLTAWGVFNLVAETRLWVFVRNLKRSRLDAKRMQSFAKARSQCNKFIYGENS